MRRPSALVVALCLCAAGCRYFDAGVPGALDGGVARDGASPDTASPDAGAEDAEPGPSFGAQGDDGGPPIYPLWIVGLPRDVGCSDGTREGFLDLSGWRWISACAGAWSVPGVLASDTRQPQCARAAGNTGVRSDGMGCGVADLCAEGWHVCDDAVEVARASPTECESAIPAGVRGLFIVRAGASPMGVCTPDRRAGNDVLGCGNLGHPVHESCQPLDRRLGFADCADTGVWACGGEGTLHDEAAVVTKNGTALGGVLCCRDR